MERSGRRGDGKLSWRWDGDFKISGWRKDVKFMVDKEWRIESRLEGEWRA